MQLCFSVLIFFSVILIYEYFGEGFMEDVASKRMCISSQI